MGMGQVAVQVWSESDSVTIFNNGSVLVLHFVGVVPVAICTVCVCVFTCLFLTFTDIDLREFTTICQNFH